MAGGQLSKSSDGLSLSGPRSGSRSVHLSVSSFLDHTANHSSSLLPNTNTPSILNLLVLEICAAQGRAMDSLRCQLCSLFCSPTFQGGAGLVYAKPFCLHPSRHFVQAGPVPSGWKLLIRIGISQTNAHSPKEEL